MADILLRTPYFLNVTTASHLSAKLELTIDSTLRYTIVKNATSNRTVFELSTLARDYYVPDYGGATGDDVDTVSISATWYAYDAVDGGGSQLATATVTHTGYYGYNSFWDGYDDLDTTDIDVTYSGDTGTLYLPDNTASFAYEFAGGTLTKNTISTSATSVVGTNNTWTIERICNPKYDAIQMRFINKFGIPQDFYFFLKNVETISTKSETFKRNIFTQSSSSYDKKDHQTLTFNKNGRKRFTLNTDYMLEAYNDVMQDIMLSEYVWIYYDTPSGDAFVTKQWHPVTVVTSSLTKKTSVNDRLTQYALEVEDANDIINNII